MDTQIQRYNSHYFSLVHMVSDTPKDSSTHMSLSKLWEQIEKAFRETSPESHIMITINKISSRAWLFT